MISQLTLRTIAAMLILFGATPILSAHEPEKKKKPCFDAGDIGDSDNFTAYEDNFVLLANRMKNNGWAPDDERAMRGQYSFKYTLTGCPLRRNKDTGMIDVSQNGKEWEVFLAFTGAFDFYAGTRDSGPVINRISNPGLHVRVPLKYFNKSHSSVDGIEVSIEHRSNGQVFEPETPAGTIKAQAAYDAKDRYLFDTVSRGSNYIGLTGLWQYPFGEQLRSELRVKFRGYFSKSSEVTWGPMAKKGVSISDYDFAQTRLSVFPEGLGRFDFDWRVGTGLRHSSADIGWQWTGKIPYYVRAHFGPMNTLSNYTQRQDSLGVGLRFAYF